MQVCICNNLSKSSIGKAIADGASTPSEVFQRLGVRRNCSHCSDYIAGLLADAKRISAVQAAE